MAVITDWLPSALGPGVEDDEARAKYGVTTEYRHTNCAPGYEVRVAGDVQDVVACVAGWWASGDDEDDLEFLQHVVEGLLAGARTAAKLREVDEARAALETLGEQVAKAEARLAKAEAALPH